jgi:hypothetical protein
MTLSNGKHLVAGRLSRRRPFPRVAVIQDGARLHYAVPRSLALSGMLERMFTEWFLVPGSDAMVFFKAVEHLFPTAAVRRMADRSSPDIPSSRAANHLLLGIYLRLARPWFQTSERYWWWCSEQVARWIRSEGWGQADSVFGFVRNVHPRLCEAARRDGLIVVADQMIAPATVEQDQLRLEQSRWPGWERIHGQEFRLVDEIERRTWAATDHITCASEYVKTGLIGCGVPSERISIIRYPIEVEEFTAPDRSGKTGPLTVGFVGNVGLRKGSPYFLAVARRLKGRGIRFVMAGRIDVSPAAQDELARDVELTGAIPRSRVRGLLMEFDLLLFPSTCEGSAGAVTEAMAAGLPIVTSPNSGTLVDDGVHGFVRKYDDVEGMAQAVERLAADSALRQEMGEASRRAAESCSLRSYGQQLTAVFTGLAGASVGMGVREEPDSKRAGA